MKARKICVCALVCLLSMCFSVYGQSPEEASEPVINFGLAHIDEIYVRVVADGMTPEKLEDEISNRLSQNGLKVVPADVSKLNDEQMQKIAGAFKWKDGKEENPVKVYLSDVPELIVRISLLQGVESGPCVYHVQTSFAREVYLRSPRSSMKAEVWRIDVPIGIADANQCETAIRTGTLRQVDAFIAEWKKANANKIAADSQENTADVVTSATQKLYRQAGQKSQYQYVASKNSKIFHKADCRAAKKINSENLIGFSSRQEAIDSGRRPCKICNP